MLPFVIGLLVCWSLDWCQAKPAGQYAVILRSFGGPEKFTVEDHWPIPENFKDDECWLLVKAAAVYPWDKWARFNNGTRKRLKAPVVIGQEVSGIVIQCGKNVTHIKQADRVFAKMPNYEGGYKQIVLTKGVDTHPLPENFTHEEGAVSYYPFVVAHKALIHRAQISRGKSILIIGGTRDVGAAAIQIAKAYGLYPIVATAGTEAGMHFMKERGAHHVVNHTLPAFRATALFMNHNQKFDVVFNTNAEDYDVDMEFCKNPGGFVVYHDQIDIETETHGYHHYKETMMHEPEDCNSSLHHVLKYLHKGIYRPHINKTFYMDEIGHAHREVASPDVIGDMVLTKVHRDQYIHLSNCENFGRQNISRPITYIGTINYSDPTPTMKIAQFRFNFTAANSFEQSSISQYLYTLAFEELYGGTHPPSTTELVTYSFESLYNAEDLGLSKEKDYDAHDVSKVLGGKKADEDTPPDLTKVLGGNKTIQRFMAGL